MSHQHPDIRAPDPASWLAQHLTAIPNNAHSYSIFTSKDHATPCSGFVLESDILGVPVDSIVHTSPLAHLTQIPINTRRAVNLNLTLPRQPPSDDMSPISARTLLLLLSSVSLAAAAVDFAQCLQNFTATNETGGVDSDGHAVPAADAVGLTYETCKARCGTTAESLSWTQFAQLFASWLLPWLALLSQLPFSSGNIGDSLLSS